MTAALADRIAALEYLALSAIAAIEKQVPGTAARTTAQAEAFVDCLRRDGLPNAALHLQGLADSIRVGGDLPVND